MKPRIAIGMSQFAELPKWVECQIVNLDKATIHKGIAEIDFPTDFWEFFDKKKDGPPITLTSHPIDLGAFTDMLDMISTDPLLPGLFRFSWTRSTGMKVVIGGRVRVYEAYIYWKSLIKNLKEEIAPALFLAFMKTRLGRNLLARAAMSGFGSQSATSKKELNP